MDRSLSRVVLVMSAAAVVLGGAACANDRTDPPTPSTPTSQTQASSAERGSTHDRVEKLLDEAEEAFDAPARTSSAGNTDKTVDNMSIVADRLMQAHDLAPYRNDLLFSAASAQIARKDVDAAVALYKQALDTAPNDVDAQSYLAGWSRYLGRRAEADNYVDQIRALDPARAEQLTAMFATIDEKVSTPLTDALPALPGPGLAIVTLGYALHDDGSMDDILIARLQQTKAAAERWPAAPIIVTGGVEQSGRTEGESMKEWLVDNGVAGDRIHDENFARSTVENASYGVEVLASVRATHALIISSASHVRRALTVFQLAAADTLGNDFPFSGSGSADKPLAELATAGPDELLSIYRDAFSSIGMWSYRSAPLLRQ
ncbi:ElyC/SanA/YdcF family protein [Mycobacterium sp. PSTR-4-N]|uniref:ElyC/SanA/YdcF family protein n=1 Tax=Mycobacterium sp. PSTR-4-N TaxID=2917745 RepID=UPI001F152F54|nr:ElyC/SanA/YdcF family protein [Mycobacterium sp. PSTR-4-N]MCG7594284.1 YdcF family protein [Mycobacterium sp. PSTR-4-N]